MSNPRFLQIHFLTQFPASLLNRDDVGLAKRLPFGGAMRTRISSQCLKRHWRMARDQWSLSNLDVGMSVRSRYTFADRIAPPLTEAGIEPSTVIPILQAFQSALLGESKKASKAKADKKKEQESSAAKIDLREELKTNQVIVLGDAEINYLVAAAKEVAQSVAEGQPADKAVDEWLTKARLENLRTLEIASGLDGAMFGRMVTSDTLARGDAAVHVAHAFTVHGEFSETDYFSAVDDLESADGALGSGHIGNTELTSGLYYGYVVVDIPLLIANLGGDEELAGKTVEHLVHLIATISPGAKLGSTAPYARASLMLLERGESQPRSLADAFLKPVYGSQANPLAESAIDSLSAHIQRIDKMYGSNEERAYASYYPNATLPNATDVESLDALADFARDYVAANEAVSV